MMTMRFAKTRDLGSLSTLALVVAGAIVPACSGTTHAGSSGDGPIPRKYAAFYLVPSTGFGIVWLANADDVAFETSVALAMDSFAGLTSPTTETPPGVAVDPSLFPSYAGTYVDPNGLGLITITAGGATLAIDVPTFDAAGTPYEQTLQPTSMDNFIVTVQGSPIPLTFIADSTGAYVWIRTQTVVAKRVPSDGGTSP